MLKTSLNFFENGKGSNFMLILLSLVMAGLLLALCYAPTSLASHAPSGQHSTASGTTVSTISKSSKKSLPAMQNAKTKKNPADTTGSRFGDFGGGAPIKTGNMAVSKQSRKQSSGQGTPGKGTVGLRQSSLKQTKKPGSEPKQHFGDFGGR